MSATVEITWHCAGCDARVGPARHRIVRKFRSFSGRDHGLGVWHYDMPNPSDSFPVGWVKDPLTCGDYCPKCAAEIWGEPDEEGGVGG